MKKLIKRFILGGLYLSDMVEDLEFIRDEIQSEIHRHPATPNIGKKGCLRRIDTVLNKYKELV